MSAVEPDRAASEPSRDDAPVAPVEGRRRSGRAPGGPSRPAAPARCLSGLRVVVAGRNRAGRLAQALEALRPAVERGAEVVYVDRGSRDGSVDMARRRYEFARTATSAADALAARGDAPPPRFVAVVDLRAEADWRCLRAIVRAASRGGAETICAPALVGADGRPARERAGPDGRPPMPPVWCARARTARRVLTGSGVEPQPRSSFSGERPGQPAGEPLGLVEVAAAPALLLEAAAAASTPKSPVTASATHASRPEPDGVRAGGPRP